MAGDAPNDAGEDRDLEIALAGYRRWNSGDFSGLADLFTEDIAYYTAPEWPGKQEFHGADEVIHFLEHEVAKVIALRVDVVRAERIGTEVLIELRADTKGEMSGLELLGSELFHVASMRDGRVSRVRVFMTRDEAIAAAEGG